MYLPRSNPQRYTWSGELIILITWKNSERFTILTSSSTPRSERAHEHDTHTQLSRAAAKPCRLNCRYEFTIVTSSMCTSRSPRYLVPAGSSQQDLARKRHRLQMRLKQENSSSPPLQGRRLSLNQRFIQVD